MNHEVDAVAKQGAVVIVNWNKADITVQCVTSVINGHVSPGLIVVVDNGSMESDYRQLEADLKNFVVKGVRLIRSNENRGFGAGANLGYWYAKARGVSTVWFLNNDATVDRFAYKFLLDAASRNHKWGALCSAVHGLDGEPWYVRGRLGKFSGVVWHGKNLRLPYETGPIEVDFAPGCSLLIPVDVVEPPFSERYFMYGEDVELSVAIRKAGRSLFAVPQSVVVHAPSSSIGGSPDFFYYMARNRLLVTNFTGHRWWAALPWVLQRDVFVSLLKSPKHVSAAIQGVFDYFRGVSGRRS